MNKKRIKVEPAKDQRLEQTVNDISSNPWYREETDKLFRGTVITGAVAGTLLAMYGHQVDKDFIKGIGYGMLYADSLIGLSIFAESYFRNRFNKYIARRSAEEK